MKLSEMFFIDEKSFTGLSWKITVGRGRGHRKHGDPAGCFDKSNGYFRVSVNKKLCSTATVIWLISNDLEKISDGFVVDHIDGNPLNNSVFNLRLVDISKNRRNCKMLNTNSSGHTGVYLHKQQNYLYWVAFWYEGDNSKKKERFFSVIKYGMDSAKKLAVKARTDAVNQMNQCGAGYTARHGI